MKFFGIQPNQIIFKFLVPPENVSSNTRPTLHIGQQHWGGLEVRRQWMEDVEMDEMEHYLGT